MKYLRVVINYELKFNKTREMMQTFFCKKSTVSKDLTANSPNTAKLHYTAIILPHLDYCSSILFLANNSELSYLQKLQNRMIRTILRSRLDTPNRNMMETLNYLSVRQRVTYNTMVKIKQINQWHRQSLREVSQFVD
jgi:hypothetical protein